MNWFFMRAVPALLMASILYVNAHSWIHILTAQDDRLSDHIASSNREVSRWRSELSQVQADSKKTDVAVASLSTRMESLIEAQREMQRTINNLFYGLALLSFKAIFEVFKDILKKRAP